VFGRKGSDTLMIHLKLSTQSRWLHLSKLLYSAYKCWWHSGQNIKQ